jgi:hypothetical protein
MSSIVRKLVKCDRCGYKEESEAVSQLPAGWGRITGEGRGTKDLCGQCISQVMAQCIQTDVAAAS